MRTCRWLLICTPLITTIGSSGAQAETVAPRDGTPCVQCHASISVSFANTRMARAASGSAFVGEWNANGRAPHCMRCHAPSGGPGLVCGDCHGQGPHPYPEVQVPDACARCHDAPGENTVRRFQGSPAAVRGEDCIGCHLPVNGIGTDHAFSGPTTPGFLDQVATIRAFLRRDESGELTAVLQIAHRAGHALPGGTTGRSVWLLIQGLRDDGIEVWRETIRFGWEHHPDRGWIDRTLPPGRPATIELSNPQREGAVGLRLELWYRFRPGPLAETDPRSVRLDQQQIGLPL